MVAQYSSFPVSAPAPQPQQIRTGGGMNPPQPGGGGGDSPFSQGLNSLADALAKRRSSPQGPTMTNPPLQGGTTFPPPGGNAMASTVGAAPPPQPFGATSPVGGPATAPPMPASTLGIGGGVPSPMVRPPGFSIPSAMGSLFGFNP